MDSNSGRWLTCIFIAMQVVVGHSDIRNALRIHALLGQRVTDANLRKHSEGQGQVPSVHSA